MIPVAFRHRSAVCLAALLLIAGLPSIGRAQTPDAASLPAAQIPAPPGYPADWLDLPTAPMLLELKPVGGVLHLVLTNRSQRDIVGADVGCVRPRAAGGYEVLSEFAGVTISDSAIRPEHHVDMSHQFDRPRDQSAAKPVLCPRSRAAVTRVSFADGSEWQARAPR
jgi:hypothetical protein